MTTQTALQIVRAHYDASDAGDLASMLAPLAHDVQWREAAGFPCAGLYIGPEAVRTGVFEALPREWPDYRFELEEILDAGERIVGIGTYTGTHRESKRAFRARVAHLWRVRDGEVIAFEQIVDSVPVQNSRRTG